MILHGDGGQLLSDCDNCTDEMMMFSSFVFLARIMCFLSSWWVTGALYQSFSNLHISRSPRNSDSIQMEPNGPAFYVLRVTYYGSI